jgi:hypothetical protein
MSRSISAYAPAESTGSPAGTAIRRLKSMVIPIGSSKSTPRMPSIWPPQALPMGLKSMAGSFKSRSLWLPNSTSGKETSRALMAALPLHDSMWICLDSPAVKDFRLRMVVAPVSSRNRRFSPATFMVTTGRRSQRSIGTSSRGSCVWAQADPERQANRKTSVARRVVGFTKSLLVESRVSRPDWTPPCASSGSHGI